MEIEKIIQQQFGEIVESGFVEMKIRENLEKTIASIINDCLKSYSDFGKEVKEKVKQSLSIGNMDLKLPEYNQLVCNWITEMINTTLISTGKKQIEENIKKFFKPLEKSEYKISEIIEKFIDDLDESDCEDITFIRNKSDTVDGYIHYYFDKNSNIAQYSCDYQIWINKDGVWNVIIASEKASEMKTAVLYGFDSFLFQLYACKVKIIDDYEDVVTSRDRDD